MHWYGCPSSLSTHPLRAIGTTIIVRHVLFLCSSVYLYLLKATAPTSICGLRMFLGSLSLYVCDVRPFGLLYQHGCLDCDMCEVPLVQRCIHTHVLVEARDVLTDILK